ncbi:hypothetical protein HAU30_09160 [Weissella confusa]|uniref:hypothetical protein n=1 Tax=Weissella confusa TaxID=1583 RepID=UPI0018F1CFC0|nr:hypothetical protein [Weissella confusa]MBJ7680627.1 hypothetical protein [Weissella confusa]
MSLDSTAIEKIEELALGAQGNVLVEKDGFVYSVTGDGARRLEFDDNPDRIELHTLQGLVDFINNSYSGVQLGFIHVLDARTVILYGELDKFGNRPKLAVVTPFTKPFAFGDYYQQEQFQIGLRSQFVPNDHRDILIKFAGDLVDKDEQTYQDDGISQTAMVKTGVVSQGVADVPSPVTLKPYRTFIEVDQPESEFIFRVQKGARMALFEADGGAWKNEAINRVKAWLQAQFTDTKVIG